MLDNSPLSAVSTTPLPGSATAALPWLPYLASPVFCFLYFCSSWKIPPLPLPESTWSLLTSLWPQPILIMPFNCHWFVFSLRFLSSWQIYQTFIIFFIYLTLPALTQKKNYMQCSTLSPSRYMHVALLCFPGLFCSDCSWSLVHSLSFLPSACSSPHLLVSNSICCSLCGGKFWFILQIACEILF